MVDFSFKFLIISQKPVAYFIWLFRDLLKQLADLKQESEEELQRIKLSLEKESRSHEGEDAICLQSTKVLKMPLFWLVHIDLLSGTRDISF